MLNTRWHINTIKNTHRTQMSDQCCYFPWFLKRNMLTKYVLENSVRPRTNTIRSDRLLKHVPICHQYQKNKVRPFCVGSLHSGHTKWCLASEQPGWAVFYEILGNGNYNRVLTHSLLWSFCSFVLSLQSPVPSMQMRQGNKGDFGHEQKSDI